MRITSVTVAASALGAAHKAAWHPRPLCGRQIIVLRRRGRGGKLSAVRHRGTSRGAEKVSQRSNPSSSRPRRWTAASGVAGG